MFALHEKFVINEKGKKTAIILPYAEWQKVMDALEEYDDICAYDRIKAKPSNAVVFDRKKVA